LNDDEQEILSIRTAIVELLGWYGYQLGESDPELERRYNFAKSQAQFLGSTILGYFNEVLYQNDVRDRAVRNFPTQADKRANNIVVNAIQHDSVTREDGIVSEESMEDIEGLRKTIESSEFVWIIDPLDGTLNFAYAFPFFCVSLGLLREGQPVLGIIYNPTTQELYCGRKGRTSECFDLSTGTKRTLELNSSKKLLEDCVVMTHLSISNREARNKTISILDRLIHNTRGVRMLGSGQRALVSLALGQFDMFFNYHTHIWDIVPGYVILKNAGGYATSSLETGDVWDWRSRGILAASNAEIGEKLRQFLHGELRGNFPTY
jgi:myo-inositol-1(or 4)-monophosphatase